MVSLVVKGKFGKTSKECQNMSMIVASYRQMKYLETNLICILNVVILPVGMQHDIAYGISVSIE